MSSYLILNYVNKWNKDFFVNAQYLCIIVSFYATRINELKENNGKASNAIGKEAKIIRTVFNMYKSSVLFHLKSSFMRQANKQSGK